MHQDDRLRLTDFLERIVLGRGGKRMKNSEPQIDSEE